MSLSSSSRCVFLYFENRLTRHRVGYAEPAAQVFERVAESIEHCNHLGTRGDDASVAVPFPDRTVGAIAGLDDHETPEAGEVRVGVTLRVEKLGFAAGLHPESHHIECSHGGSSRRWVAP